MFYRKRADFCSWIVQHCPIKKEDFFFLFRWIPPKSNFRGLIKFIASFYESRFMALSARHTFQSHGVLGDNLSRHCRDLMTYSPCSSRLIFIMVPLLAFINKNHLLHFISFRLNDRCCWIPIRAKIWGGGEEKKTLERFTFLVCLSYHRGHSCLTEIKFISLFHLKES